jgi:hypothetical protein
MAESYGVPRLTGSARRRMMQDARDGSPTMTGPRFLLLLGGASGGNGGFGDGGGDRLQGGSKKDTCTGGSADDKAGCETEESVP